MSRTLLKLARVAIAVAVLGNIFLFPEMSVKAHEGNITTYETRDPDDLISSSSSHIGGRGDVRVCLVNNGSNEEPKEIILTTSQTEPYVTIALFVKFRGSTKCKTIRPGSTYIVRYFKNGRQVHTSILIGTQWGNHQILWNWNKD